MKLFVMIGHFTQVLHQLQQVLKLMNCEIIVLGNSFDSASDLSIGHSVMKDAIDLNSIIEALTKCWHES